MHHIRAWLLSWELYLIILLATFLRLYGIRTTEFDADQADIFSMAYGAVHHGLLVATANAASIHILNPPGIIYLLMTTAAWSGDPFWAAVMQAVSSIIAVLLTYIFVRRYYGRLAATFAALLFATAQQAVYYSRFIWQQNLIPFFLLIFFFTLFWGVVERRKGWLFPALFLWGLLLQLHATGGLLLAPLLIAILLSLGTLRWRDLYFSLIALLLMYTPYILWEVSSNFYDVHILRAQSHLPSTIDNLAITYYQFFVTPYTTVIPESKLFTNTHSVLFPIFHQLALLTPIFSILIIAGAITVLIQACSSRATGQTPPVNTQAKFRVLQPVVNWWMTLRASPYRCGLWILLVWQIVPLLMLSRHTLPIYPHYFIVSMPGQYIFIGLFLANVVHWATGQGNAAQSNQAQGNVAQGDQAQGNHKGLPLQWNEGTSQAAQGNHKGLPLQWNEGTSQADAASIAGAIRGRRGLVWWRTIRYATLGIACLLIVGQCIGSTGTVLDYVHGNYPDSIGSSDTYYNDLHSIQNALHSADQLAQQHHLARIYIGTDFSTQIALTLLSEQLQTPVTLFDSRNCMVLPAVQYGPSVMLVGPSSPLTVALLQHFAQATLVEQPQRLGGPPFQLYIVNPVAQSGPVQAAFQGHLGLLDKNVHTLQTADSSWFVTSWEMQHAVPPAFRVTYNYDFTAQTAGGHSEVSKCSFSTMRAGDQLLVAFRQDGAGVSGPVDVGVRFGMVGPRDIGFGSVRFETDMFVGGQGEELVGGDGGKSVRLVSGVG